MTAKQEGWVKCIVALSRLYRHSLKDLCIGDEEVFWTADEAGIGEYLASGYFGRQSSVSLMLDGQREKFEGDEVRTFKHVGRKGRQEFN